MSAVQTSERETLTARWLAFVRAHGDPCFTGWPDSIVAAWLEWHAVHHSLLVIHQGDEILALATGWQCFETELEQHWYADNPAGDCFYFSHAIATSPAALAALLAEFNQLKPGWRRLKLFWRRAGKGLIPVPARTLEKLFNLAQRAVAGGHPTKYENEL